MSFCRIIILLVTAAGCFGASPAAEKEDVALTRFAHEYIWQEFTVTKDEPFSDNHYYCLKGVLKNGDVELIDCAVAEVATKIIVVKPKPAKVKDGERPPTIIVVAADYAKQSATIRELRPKFNSAEYGRRVRYSDGVLHYPEFIVRYDKRVEYRPPGTNLYAISYLFDVLDNKEKKVAEFEFNFSGLAMTTATFEVSGKTFVAELTYTTAGQPMPREVPPKQNGELAEGEIVVWDESTARTGNLQLLEFWKKE